MSTNPKRPSSFESPLKRALEHCELHDTYFDPMDDEALEKAQGRARELVETNDSTVALFNGNEEELVELLDDVVADAEESCSACKEEGDDAR